MFGFLGSQTSKPLKQPQVFVELAESFSNRDDVEFVMAGTPSPGWDKWAGLEQRMAALKNFSYIGAQPQEAINELLDRSHLLVNTSSHEGFSNVFIQAWLRETPIVTLNADPDGLLSSRRGGILALGSFERLKSAVTQFVDDAELRSSIGAQAREFAETTFSMGNIERLVGILD